VLSAPAPRRRRHRPDPRAQAGPGRRRPGDPQPGASTQRSGAARPSQLARGADDSRVEARIREGAILAACLHHPAVALAFERRLETLAVSWPRHGEIRDALLKGLAGFPDEPQSVAARVAALLGRDPLPELSPEFVRANRHLGPAADPEMARRAIEEELTRHAALTGRDAEIREAALEMSEHPDEALTVRVRAATDAEHAANVKPLEDDQSADETERLEFATVMNSAEASRSRKPRKR
jgi:hypothetical protein